LSTNLLIIGVDQIHNNLVETLPDSAYLFIPKHKKNLYKFWWSQELDQLKLKAIASCRAWKNASKPEHGKIFSKYRQDELLYKKCISEEQFCEIKVTPIILVRHCCANLAQPSGRSGKLNLKIKILILYK